MRRGESCASPRDERGAVAPWRPGARRRGRDRSARRTHAAMPPRRCPVDESCPGVLAASEQSWRPAPPPDRRLLAVAWLAFARAAEPHPAPRGHERDAQDVLGVLGVLLVARCMGGVALTQSQCRQCRSAARSEIRLAINAARRAYLGLPGPTWACRSPPRSPTLSPQI